MVKVAVLGAGGGIGLPLSLLLKLSPLVDELSLFDIRGAHGVATDLSHINSKCKVSGFDANPKDRNDETAIKKCLTNTNIILISAGVARKPGMTRNDLFKINAGIVKSLATSVAKYAPDSATVLIISNPVNSTVPVFIETMKRFYKVKGQEYKIKAIGSRVVGVTNLDLVRAKTFLNEQSFKEKNSTIDDMPSQVTVIGGHSGDTIIPLLLNKKHSIRTTKVYTTDTYKKYIKRIKFGGDEVVAAKQGAGSATLSMAFAGYSFTLKVLNALRTGRDLDAATGIGERELPAFVYLEAVNGGQDVQNKVKKLSGTDTVVDYFAVPLRFDGNGHVVAVDSSVLDELASEEERMVGVAVKGLVSSIKKGVDFVNGQSKL